MSNPISSLSNFPAAGMAGNPALFAAGPGAPAAGSVSFQDVLLKSLEQVTLVDQQAQGAIEVGLTNGDLTQAEIFTAMKKTDLAFRTMLQIRNKVLDAYREVQQMRM